MEIYIQNINILQMPLHIMKYERFKKEDEYLKKF